MPARNVRGGGVSAAILRTGDLRSCLNCFFTVRNLVGDDCRSCAGDRGAACCVPSPSSLDLADGNDRSAINVEMLSTLALSTAASGSTEIGSNMPVVAGEGD